MSLDVWFKSDIKNVLLALHVASTATANSLHTDPYQRKMFREGYTAALASVALAFGIPIQSMPQVETITDGNREGNHVEG